jgi:ADP-ribose pyrophosphatase
MKLRERTFRKRKIYGGRNIDFYSDLIKLPDGKSGTREYVTHPGAVAVIPFLNENEIVLVRQFRYPVGKITREIPAGKIGPGENLVACVRRELAEETGFRAGRIKKLISYWPSPAFSDEILHIYAAYGLSPTDSSPDEDEFIEKLVLPFDRALKWVYEGKIKDSKTVIALLLYRSLKECKARGRGGQGGRAQDNSHLET